MISRHVMAKTEYGRSLLKFFERLTCFTVNTWGSDSSDPDLTTERFSTTEMDDAHVASSLLRASDAWGEERHTVVLDIDHPAWLVRSTTPDHYHLYIDVPGGIRREDYDALLVALANANVIEPGYAGASRARGHSDVRLPWIEKENAS